jgi:hypothetical protein
MAWKNLHVRGLNVKYACMVQFRIITHMSLRFTIFMYLKCQMDLDACHHLIAAMCPYSRGLLTWISCRDTCHPPGSNDCDQFQINGLESFRPSGI